MTDVVHDSLPCGLEYVAWPLPKRRVVAFQIRVLSGACNEPCEKLGLARLVSETIDKGTQRRTGRELADAFDAIGASVHGAAGRESTTFTCTVLPEYFEQAVALHAEFLCTPTFPADAVRANIELAVQEIDALEDDAQSLTDKLIGREAYGALLGRHPLGERDTLGTIGRDDLEAFWRTAYGTGRMLVAVVGPIEPAQVAAVFEKQFEGFGPAEKQGREPYSIAFSPGTKHHAKALEQHQLAICWPGVSGTHDEFPTQQVFLGILSGGMSGRLFTEVREKRGLVYWVGAWHETPRGAGRMFLGASTTPLRADETFDTLLREVDRVAQDVEPSELERVVTGILASWETRGDSTRARCSELAGDLFIFGRPVPKAEKIRRIERVTIRRIRDYVKAHPRDPLCVVTVGSKPLSRRLAGGDRASTSPVGPSPLP